MSYNKITDFIKGFIDSSMKIEESNYIIRNLSYFSDDYIPEKIFHRDKEFILLSKYLFLDRGNGTSINIYGKTGTGKTVVVKFFGRYVNLYSLEKKLPLKFIYVNSKFYSSKSIYFVFKDIVSKISGIPIKNGVKNGELYEMFSYYVNSSNKRYIIALDEVDALLSDEESNDLLYLLLRSSKISLITISNTLSFYRYLDSRVLSSMSSIKIPFKPYDALQIFDVVYDRAKKALYPDAIEESALRYLSSWVARDSGDMRKAIQLLRNSAILAESENSGKVTVEHVQAAIENYEVDSFYDEVQILPLSQIILVLALLEKSIENKNNNIELNDAYEKYVELCNNYGIKPITKSAFSRKINELTNTLYGFLETEVIYMGRKGKKKIIHLQLDTKKMKTVIDKLKKRFL